MACVLTEREEDEDEKGSEEESLAHSGSLSAQYGGTQPLLHSQFSLHIREQKINQITLLQVSHTHTHTHQSRQTRLF